MFLQSLHVTVVGSYGNYNLTTKKGDKKDIQAFFSPTLQVSSDCRFKLRIISKRKESF